MATSFSLFSLILDFLISICSKIKIFLPLCEYFANLVFFSHVTQILFLRNDTFIMSLALIFYIFLRVILSLAVISNGIPILICLIKELASASSRIIIHHKCIRFSKLIILHLVISGSLLFNLLLNIVFLLKHYYLDLI